MGDDGEGEGRESSERRRGKGRVERRRRGWFVECTGKIKIKKRSFWNAKSAI